MDDTFIIFKGIIRQVNYIITQINTNNKNIHFYTKI